MACLRMRVVDGSVLKLIRMWLETPVVEADREGNGPAKWSRSKQGTPQGGVISPLLANLYLHWFDKLFYRADGPAQWAKAKLVRYADDFVVLARYQTPRLRGWIEEKIEKWLGLEINRDKTRVVDLRRKKWLPGWQSRFRKAFDTQNVLVGELDGEIAAFATGTVDRETLVGFIDILGVDRKLQGKGYGRKMPRGMLEWLKKTRRNPRQPGVPGGQ